MKKGRWGALLAGMLSLAGTAGVAAQDLDGAPLYGTVTLRAGFTPDPNVVQVQAGGRTPAAQVGRRTQEQCSGFIHGGAPDVRLMFESSGNFLRIGARSSVDTTLIVHMPDGTWRCADDTVGLNPVLSQRNALSGQYDIWVGTYSAGAQAPAEVIITEYQREDMFSGAGGGTSPLAGAAGAQGAPTSGALNIAHAPRNSVVSLNAGFVPDPQLLSATAGGTNPVSTSNLISANGGPCRGNVGSTAPDFRVELGETPFGFLRFFVRASVDATLVIHAPNGQWYCQDDSVGTNPVIDFNNPPPGQYNVWVGVFGNTTTQPVTLGITELPSVNP